MMLCTWHDLVLCLGAKTSITRDTSFVSQPPAASKRNSLVHDGALNDAGHSSQQCCVWLSNRLHQSMLLSTDQVHPLYALADCALKSGNETESWSPGKLNMRDA